MNVWITLITHSLQHSQLAAFFLDLLLKSFVLLGVTRAISIFWRRSAASARHLVWVLAVAGSLCLPGFSCLLPAWQKPLWTVVTRVDSANELTFKLVFTPAKAASGALPPAVAMPAAGAISDSVQGASKQGIAAGLRTEWVALLMALWMTGTILLLISIALGQLRLRALQNAAQPTSNVDWLRLLRRLCSELRIHRRVLLLQSGAAVMPATWGWWRPVILLPAEATQWSEERFRIVLTHELAHIKRWDCLTQVIAQLACAFYWLNPLIWVAARQMRFERERACDDMVLEGTRCKASDYAAHLVAIARIFRSAPLPTAIGMARSSNLERRIAAIVDVSRVRYAPRSLFIALCATAVVAVVATLAAQKPETNTLNSASHAKPWYDARLRAFFAAKEAQARQFAEQKPVPPEAWPYFEAGIKGDWQTATNLWVAMRRRAHQYEGGRSDPALDNVWNPILETDLAWEEFSHWKEKYVLAYGNDIMKSIPPGSIYFGGTDPGRGLITALSESHAHGKPFFTLTQNALADSTYLEYLRAMYGAKIFTPTDEDSQKSFEEYTADAQRRLAAKELKPGEDVQMVDGKIVVQGQVAVMAIDGLIAKIIFERNPEREFFIEESYPLDWMYPYLLPNGLIMKINREASSRLSDEVIQQDHAYWSHYLQPILGNWLKYDTSVAEVVAFTEKVYLKHDLAGFKGDPLFVEDTWAQKAYSKLRNSISGIYAWRMQKAKTPKEKELMSKEADFACRQAFALCPTSPEALDRYVNLLVDSNRPDDARLLIAMVLKLDPQNPGAKDLLKNLKGLKSNRRDRSESGGDLK